MDTIKRIETIPLLKKFIDFLDRKETPKFAYLFEEDKENLAKEFLSQEFKEITDPETDIWSILRTNKNN